MAKQTPPIDASGDETNKEKDGSIAEAGVNAHEDSSGCDDDIIVEDDVDSDDDDASLDATADDNKTTTDYKKINKGENLAEILGRQIFSAWCLRHRANLI